MNLTPFPLSPDPEEKLQEQIDHSIIQVKTIAAQENVNFVFFNQISNITENITLFLLNIPEKFKVFRTFDKNRDC